MLRTLTFSLAIAVATCLSPNANADLLTHIEFDGGSIGQTLAANSAISGLGTVTNFDGFVNAANSSYVAGLTGSLGGSGNAIQLNNGSARFRAIIDRTSATWQGPGAGLLENPANPNTLIGGGGVTGSLFGSVLINNPNGAAGFSGLEFAAGDPNANRVITVGEAPNNTLGGTQDFVVLGPGQAGQNVANDLALPTVVAGETREIVFRIDYTPGVDTFTLIDPDTGLDVPGGSGTGSFQFSTLHLAQFSAPANVIYDEIRLGTTLADVTGIPEPSSLTALGTLALSGLGRRKRRMA